MINRKFRLTGAAALAAVALTLAACSSGGGNTATSSGSGGESSSSESAGGGDTGSAAGIVIGNGSEPEVGLIPANTNEVGGGKILDLMFAGLVYYDADGKPHNDMAESITATDASNYTIKIAPGHKFTNGDPVTAKSFVDAWNWSAKASNAFKNAYFFEDIDGFNADADSDLTGLVVVDENTFTVKLNKPASDFPLRLGYSAFYPLPASALTDAKAFGENPIGNGPYKFASDKAWQHNVQVDLVVNPDYTGARKAKNGGVTLKFYDSFDSAYNDLQADNLDVLDQIPDTSIGTFQDELGERAVSQPGAVFQSFTIPERLEHFSGEEGKLRRQAISLAINREEISTVILKETRTPAKDFTSPVIDGWSDSIAGNEVLNYDPEKAKQLWAQADAISPWSGKFQIAYNSDGPHQGWVDAVCNGLNNVLGIEASGAPTTNLSELRKAINDRSIQTAFRTGWQADYPGMYNFLGPLYATGASSNDGDYTNPAFDALLATGNSAADPAAGLKSYQDAQTILFQDLPAIPLWYQNTSGGFSKNVSDVKFGWNSVPIFDQIVKK